jgi:pyridoxamine 5'-phosphate oxidase family protein
MNFTEAEVEFLESLRLCRIATAHPRGSIQNNPVVYWYNKETDTIDIGGRALGTTQKFKNIQDNGKVSIVIDEVVSRTPWRVRGLEVRGRGEALTDQLIPPHLEFLSPELIRIHPRRILSWGIESEHMTMTKRSVSPSTTAPA